MRYGLLCSSNDPTIPGPEISISVDALEAGLRFPLHPTIVECLRWWRISPSQMAPNSWRYLIAFLGECRGEGIVPTQTLFFTCFRLCKSRGGYYLTAQDGFKVSGALDLDTLGRKLRMPSGNTPATGAESSPPEVEEIRVETTTKRPVGNPAPDQAVAGRPGKWVKIVMRKHKSRHGDGSSWATAREKEPEAPAKEDSSPSYRRPRSMKDLCGTRICKDDEGYYVLQMADWAPRDPGAAIQARWSNLSYLEKVWVDSQAASEFGREVLQPTLAKDLYTLPSEILMAQEAKQIMLMALLDRVHDAGRLVTIMGNQASLLEAEIDKLKTEGDPERLATARQQANKELNELREGLAESQCSIKEQKADRRKADDKLLRLMRENETLKPELPNKSVADYKQSAGFEWGLRRMGQISYEYGYRVALARFQAWYPDLEVDNDPFTEKPEDSSMPMETRQEFDDSIPPEE
ncbi:hypothetical protein BHM03_00023157 [Ensete ventricosum]|nr:hypothetical protein BHM03_00023157 [Ensete ventricosum]